MKTTKLIIIAMVLFLYGTTQAQVTVNVSLGTPPPWGPYGYNDVRYYYLPDIEAYYDVQSSMFIYWGEGVWVHRAYLPARYHGYDLYGGYKVVMNNYHGNYPYTHFKEHRMKYAKGYHGNKQRNIGQKPGKGGNPGNNYSGHRSTTRNVGQSKPAQNKQGGGNKGNGHGNNNGGGGKGKKR